MEGVQVPRVAGRLIAHEPFVPLAPIEVKQRAHETGIPDGPSWVDQRFELRPLDPQFTEPRILEQFPHQLPGDQSLGRDSLPLLLVPPRNPMRLGRDGDQWVRVEQTPKERRSRAGTAHDEDERIHESSIRKVQVPFWPLHERLTWMPASSRRGSAVLK